MPVVRCAAALLLCSSGPATAHLLGLTDSAIEIAESGVRIVQTLPREELAELGRTGDATLRGEDAAPGDAGRSGDTGIARGAGVPGDAGAPGGTQPRAGSPLPVDAARSGAAWTRAVAAGWRVTVNGNACVPAAASARDLPAIDAVQFDLRFDCEVVTSTLEVAYPLASRFESTHVNVARVLIGRGRFPFRFHRERQVLRLPLDAVLARSGMTLPASFREDDPNAELGADRRSPSAQLPAAVADVPSGLRGQGSAPELDLGAAIWTIGASYLPAGVEHIVFGPDHLAFVLALVLVPLALRRLALAVTLFTLAHSVTLGLSYFQVLALPPSITEPLIALSVAAVGVENLLAARSLQTLRLREFTVFCFGLVHGVGLSYQLGELPAHSPLEAALRLLMFNLGVELGQLAVLVFPGTVLIWAVRRQRGRIVSVGGSSILVVVGAFWFLSRTVFV